MNKELEYLSIYFKRLVFQWVTVLMFLPSLYDFFQTYLPEPFKSFELPNDLKLIWMVAAILFAFYRVWRSDYIVLQASKKEESTYNVVPSVYRFSNHKILQEIDSEIEKQKKDLPNLPSNFMGIRTDFFSRDSQNVSEYVEELKSYREEIKAFIEKNKNTLVLFVEINSDKYDEQISANLSVNSAEIKHYSELDPPIKPSVPGVFNLLGSSLDTHRNIEPFRKHINYSKHSVSCELKSIRKSDPISFLGEGMYFANCVDAFSYKISVNSKNSNGTQDFIFELDPQDVSKKIDLLDLGEDIYH